MAALAVLPDDILLIILAELESARDVRGLALGCRRLHRLVAHEGWRVFVRARFPSLSIPAATSGDGWRRLAESLTWQSWCWDRRSLRFSALQSQQPQQPQQQLKTKQQRTAPYGRAAFQPVIDARLTPDRDMEMVIWGAGEDVMARYRRRGAAGAPASTSWHGCEGARYGYEPGYDDVRALAIVEPPHRNGYAILTGRDNGDLCLLSAEPDRFGDRLAQFRRDRAERPASRLSTGVGFSQDAVLSLDVAEGLVAASTKDSVLLYRLPRDETYDVAPHSVYDLRQGVFDQPNTLLGNARWMGGGDVMALALRNSKDPLRYLTLTPHGWSPHVAAKIADIERQAALGRGNICPNSLQPVRPYANPEGATNLLLSAWRDGTCRLQDLRTPSPFDVTYQDNIHPWAEMEALLTYGTERFVGGDMHGPTIKVFDFRWPKGYYHTSGLPCSGMRPFPRPPQPFSRAPEDAAVQRRACCDHLRGLRCRWHALSRNIYYRPNATFLLSQSLPRDRRQARVWSLAKASDASPGFYLGVSGAIVEAELRPTDGGGGGDPNLGFADGRADAAGLRATVMETGDGLASPMNLRTIRLPPVYSKSRAGRPARLQDVDATLRKRHRLEGRFQDEGDFVGLEAEAEGEAEEEEAEE